MKKSSLLSFAFALLLFGGAARALPPFAQSDIPAEEYAVYSAVIRELYFVGKIKLVVISNPTSRGSESKVADYVFEELAPLSHATYDDYLAKNSKQYRLSNSLSLKARYVLVEDRTIKKLFNHWDLDKGWETFYKQYPASKGFFSLSRVGFNPTKDQALVYIGRMCNSRCGEGRLVLMSKRNDTWTVEKEHGLWVS